MSARINLTILITSIYLFAILSYSFACFAQSDDKYMKFECFDKAPGENTVDVILIEDPGYQPIDQGLIRKILSSFCADFWLLEQSSQNSISFAAPVNANFMDVIDYQNLANEDQFNPCMMTSSPRANTVYKECICDALSNYSLTALSDYVSPLHQPEFITSEDACMFYYGEFVKSINTTEKYMPELRFGKKTSSPAYSASNWIEHNKFSDRLKVVFTNIPIFTNNLNQIRPESLLRGGFELGLNDPKSTTLIISLFPFIAQNGYFKEYGRYDAYKNKLIGEHISGILFSNYLACTRKMSFNYSDTRSMMYPLLQYRFGTRITHFP